MGRASPAEGRCCLRGRKRRVRYPPQAGRLKKAPCRPAKLLGSQQSPLRATKAPQGSAELPRDHQNSRGASRAPQGPPKLPGGPAEPQMGAGVPPAVWVPTGVGAHRFGCPGWLWGQACSLPRVWAAGAKGAGCRRPPCCSQAALAKNLPVSKNGAAAVWQPLFTPAPQRSGSR